MRKTEKNPTCENSRCNICIRDLKTKQPKHTHTCPALRSVVTMYLQQSAFFQDITSCRFFVPLISFLRVVCLLDFFLSSEILYDQAVLYREFHKTSCSVCAPCGLCCAKMVLCLQQTSDALTAMLNKGFRRWCSSGVMLFWLWACYLSS